MTENSNNKVLLAHGGGGQLTDQLIRSHILPNLQNETLSRLGDSAEVGVNGEHLYFTTDSYVVKPLFFNGGDIGKLAVCGTINDLAVAGARPLALSLALILEDGLDFETLDRVLESVGRTARENNIDIVTGDTKTVESGSADGIFINTAGIGVKLPGAELGVENITVGDKVIISGTIGDHGLTIISQRKGMRFESELRSDCAALAPLTCRLLESVDGIRFLRDPTRGGLAATLNEIAVASGLSIELHQDDIPINPTVHAAAEMLGFDLLNIANEGKFAAVVTAECAGKCIEICREHPLGRDARVIGTVIEAQGTPLVEMITSIGGRRIVQMPYGRELPRIC